MTADVSRALCLASANLPIYSGDNTKIFLFGRRPEDVEVVALVHKVPGASDEAIVRLHSVCLTGDVFGSAKCDCGAQLRLAVEAISRADHGIVLYFMYHEGRGIGLLNKVKAYALQDEGLDTVEANVALGFEPDLRDFSIAADALRELGVTRIRLLTNNPDKLAAIEGAGIEVIERVTLDAPLTEHNRDYLDTKRRFFGHMPARDPATDYVMPHAFARLFEGRIEESVAWPGSCFVEITIKSYWPIRDSLGSDAANALLVAIVEKMKDTAGADQILARAADDRIMLLLQGPPARRAERIAARMRETIGGSHFEWRGRSYPILVQVQVSQLMPGADLTATFDKGDRKLTDDVTTTSR